MSKKRTRQDDARLEQLIEELIQGVNVSNRLVFLADRAGLFKFDLAQLLNDYLNDVQVVTEFEDYRRQLLDIFHDVMWKIHRYFKSSELYLVAHSEGTVIAFMGLLKGLAGKAEWAGHVRGLMTIGSPLNKHVRFWPELFEKYQASVADPALAANPIPWKNYYDFGDPIGYDLTPTRKWMQGQKWDKFFVFRDGKDDIGFTRYYFPGAAHNDYWRDEVVFGHFIEEVVDPGNAVLKRADGKRYGVPTTRGLARATSYPMPYFLSAALLFLACYILYKAVRACLDPTGAEFEGPLAVLRNVLGLAGIIGGMSLLARMPRLSRGFVWRLWAFALAALFTSGYFLISADNRRSIEGFLTNSGFPHGDPYLNAYNAWLLVALVAGTLLLLVQGLRPILLTLLPILALVLLYRIGGALFDGLAPAHDSAFRWKSLALLSVAWSIGLLAWGISWLYPTFGTKPLVHTGGLIILMIVATQIANKGRHPSAREQANVEGDDLAIARAVDEEVDAAYSRILTDPRSRRKGIDTPASVADREFLRDAASTKIVADAALDQQPIWPVFLAAPAFLYLWWVAVLLFDLTFVWHLYIRHGGAQKFVEAWFGSS